MIAIYVQTCHVATQLLKAQVPYGAKVPWGHEAWHGVACTLKCKIAQITNVSTTLAAFHKIKIQIEFSNDIRNLKIQKIEISTRISSKNLKNPQLLCNLYIQKRKKAKNIDKSKISGEERKE